MRVRKATEKQLDPTEDSVTVEHYLSIVAHRIQVLIRRIEGFDHPAYLDRSPVALSGILVRLLSRYFEELRALSDKIGAHPSDDIIRQAQTIHYLIVAVVPEVIEAIKASPVDSALAPIIEAYDYIAKLVHPGTQTVIYPTWEYNASFFELMNVLKSMAKSLGEDASGAVFSGAPLFFPVMAYPIAEEDLVLRQAFLAHEVGHFVDLVKEWSKSVLEGEEQVFDPVDTTKLFEVVSEQEEERTGQLLAESIEAIEQMIRPWIRELAADIFAVCMLGPAFLLAFDEATFSPGYPGAKRMSGTHPPHHLRKRIMGEFIKDIQLDPLYREEAGMELTSDEQAVLEDVSDWLERMLDVPPPRLTTMASESELPVPVIVAIYEFLESALEKAAESLKDDCLTEFSKEPWFCRSQDMVDALKLQGLLSHGVTPTELYCKPHRDPSFAAVMNSGWFHFLHETDEYLYFARGRMQISDPDEINDRYTTLQNLVAKAVEILNFRREYIRRRGDAL